MRDRDRREHHGMQSVPRGETVAIKRRHDALDADQADVGPFAHELLFERLVEQQPEDARREHLERDPQALRDRAATGPSDERHRGHEYVPENTVTQTRDHSERVANQATATGGIRQQTNSSFGAIDSNEERVHEVTALRDTSASMTFS